MKLARLFTLLFVFAALSGFTATGKADDHTIPQFIGDYDQIANLTYISDDCDRGAPASIALAICQMQDYLQYGTDIPRSPHFLRWVAAQQDPFDDIYPVHGFSSPFLSIKLASEIGAPTLASCPRTTAGRFTQAMYADAAASRRQNGLLNMNDVPDYPSALNHLAANPGDAIQLATDGWDGYAIIGLNQQGRGIWLRFYDGRFLDTSIRRAVVDFPTEQEGIARWRNMVEGNMVPPINYMTVWTMQE